jgi:uncharacterized membrane protein
MVLDEVLHDYTVYKYVLLYMYLFLAGSISGYIIEVLYRRFVSVKRWVNPGFNKGPWIPLYGCGVVVMSAITTSFVALFHSNGIALYNPYDLYGTGVGSGPTPYDLIPILIMGVGMTLLELVAGLIFVKGFKVRLWDYSNDKHNFMGIICPLFSVIWIVVAILFYYCLSPFITHKAQQDVASILMLNDYSTYTIDRKDYHIIDHSSDLVRIFPDVKKNLPCYKALYGLNKRCGNCPLATSEKKLDNVNGSSYETSLTLNSK